MTCSPRLPSPSGADHHVLQAGEIQCETRCAGAIKCSTGWPRSHCPTPGTSDGDISGNVVIAHRDGAGGLLRIRRESVLSTLSSVELERPEGGTRAEVCGGQSTEGDIDLGARASRIGPA